MLSDWRWLRGSVLRPYISIDADRDPLSGFPDRIAREMCIARSRFDAAVTEEPADDRQAVPPIYLIRGASRTPTGPPALVMAPSSL